MKRKTIQLAENTIVVSLPASYVKAQGIKKGDELDVEQKGDTLTISTGKGPAKKIKEIDISNLNASLIWRLIVGAYTEGADEVKISFSNKDAFDPRTGETVPTIKSIENIVGLLIGVEIISTSQSSVTIAQISGTSTDELDRIRSRLLNILSEMASGFGEREIPDIDHLEALEAQANKLVQYATRILTKFPRKEISDQHRALQFLDNIERTADRIPDLYQSNLSKKQIKLLHACFNEVIAGLQKPKRERLEEAHKKLQELRSELKKEASIGTTLAREVAEYLMDSLCSTIIIEF